MKKTGLTFERHQEIAAELKDIRERLLTLAIEFGNAYPASGKGGLTYKKLRKAQVTVDAARCWAEEEMFREHPESASTDIYFGQPIKEPLDIESEV